jgi:hypothetical protein
VISIDGKGAKAASHSEWKTGPSNFRLRDPQLN